jgi:two-component system, LytTR family, response regulator
LNAVDYLLKPISRARLTQALERVRSPSGAIKESALDRAVRGQRSGPARFLRDTSHYLVVGEAKVLYFCSEDGLTRLVTDGGQYWMDPTLNELEQRLDPDRFFRVSRAALINLNAVVEVHPMPGGSGEVLLKHGHRLEVSRRRFRELLGCLDGVS